MSFSLFSSETINGVKSFPATGDTGIEFSSEIDFTWSSDFVCKEKVLSYSYLRSGSLLSDLPEEIIYLIFSFLSTDDLLFRVKMVCKLFNQMLSENYFKRRTMKFLGVKEIPRAMKAVGIEYGEQPLSWKRACFQFEVENNKWCDRNFRKIFKRDFSNNTSSVDVARILENGKLLMSGGRDRILSLWNIERIPILLSFNERAHTGWIWDVVPCHDHSAFSCDWDGKIIKWSLDISLRDPERIFKIGRPVLSLSVQDNLLVAGLQTGEICLIDTRTNTPDAVISERVQRSAVMGVELLGTKIISISEDKTLSVFDLKNNRQVKKSRISSSAIPVSMSVINSGLFVAQTNGTITLINSSSFKIWDVYTSSSSRLTSIHASELGSIITASRDALVSIYSPSKTLRNVRNIDIGAEAARVDYSHGILAVARADNKVTIFNTNILET